MIVDAPAREIYKKSGNQKMSRKQAKKRPPMPGAGRPLASPRGAVPYPASVPRDLAEAVDGKRAELGLTRSAAVVAALRAWLTS